MLRIVLARGTLKLDLQEVLYAMNAVDALPEVSCKTKVAERGSPSARGITSGAAPCGEIPPTNEPYRACAAQGGCG